MRNLMVTVTYNDYVSGFREFSFGPFSNLTEAGEYVNEVKRIRDEEIRKFCPKGTRFAHRNIPTVSVTLLRSPTEENVRDEFRHVLRHIPLKKEG